LFGLADLGEPGLGSFSLEEMTSLRLPFGMGIERDILFTGDFPLSVWAEAARLHGGIRAAERILYQSPPGMMHTCQVAISPLHLPRRF
jgi:hypothetical protein